MNSISRTLLLTCIVIGTASLHAQKIDEEALAQSIADKVSEKISGEVLYKQKQDDALLAIDMALIASFLVFEGAHRRLNIRGNEYYTIVNPQAPLSSILVHATPNRIRATHVIAKIAITLKRMQMHNRYVGWNPLKLIPGMLWFEVVDKISLLSRRK